MLLELLHEPRSAYLELFVAPYEGDQFSFGQDSVIGDPRQIYDQLTLPLYAALTVGDSI
jgi:hypothetical protein